MKSLTTLKHDIIFHSYHRSYYHFPSFPLLLISSITVASDHLLVLPLFLKSCLIVGYYLTDHYAPLLFYLFDHYHSSFCQQSYDHTTIAQTCRECSTSILTIRNLNHYYRILVRTPPFTTVVEGDKKTAKANQVYIAEATTLELAADIALSHSQSASST